MSSSLRILLTSASLAAIGASGGGATAIRLSGARAVIEATAAGVTIGNLSVNEPGTWVITVDPANDAGDRVSVTANVLKTTATPFNYTTATFHDLKFTATRAADGKSITQTIRLAVIDAVTLVAVDIDDISVDASLTSGADLWNLGAMVAGENRTISPNDGRWVFNSDKSKVVRGLAAWTASTTAVTVTQTHAGAANSPLATTVNITVVAEVPDYDYLVYNDAQLTSALTALSPNYNGVIELATTGVFASGQTISNRVSTGKLTLRGESAVTRTVFRTITLSGCKNLRLENLDTGDATSFADVACVRGSTAVGALCENIEIVNCIGYGGSLEPIRTTEAVLTVAPTLRDGITGAFNGLHVEDCDMQNIASAYKPTTISGHWRVIRSTGKNIYSDFISFGVATAINEVVFKDNFATQFVGRGSDLPTPEKPAGDGPHCDYIQLIATIPDEYMDNVLIEGNVYVAGEARGAAQVVFGPGGNNTTRVRASILDTLSINRAAEQQTPGSAGHDGSFTSRYITVRELPGVHTGTNLSRIDTSGVPGSERAAFVDSVGESFSGANGTIRLGNYLLPNTLVAYQAAFEGPFTGDLPTTRLGWVARYRPKADGPLAQYRDAYDYAAGVRLKPHRAVVNLLPAVAQEPDVDFLTPAMLVVGHETNITVAVPAGVQYRKATTEAGISGAAFTATAGVVNAGEYLQLKVHTSAGLSTPVTCAVTLGGITYSQTVTTRSAIQFTVVDNGDLAWSRLNTAPPSVNNQKKLLIGMRSKLDSMAPFEQIFGTNNGNAMRMSLAAGNKTSFHMITSGTLNVTSVQDANTEWNTDIIALDLTPEAAALGVGAVFRWWRNGILQEMTGTIVLTGAAVFNPNTLFGHASGNFAVLRTGDGSSGNADANLAFVWADWGDATYVIPDFEEPLNYAKWSADQINLANGSGPTGVSPKLFFHGGAAEWNDAAGILNRGSLGAAYALDKQAGTYVNPNPEIAARAIVLAPTGETTLDNSAYSAIPTGENVTITIPADLPPGITFSVE